MPAVDAAAAAGRRRAAASISTTWAVTSALGGSITSPKSQNGRSRHERAGVVDVERRPAAVAALHAERPRDRPVDAPRRRRRLGLAATRRAGRAPPRPCRRCRGSCRWRTRTPSRPARGRGRRTDQSPGTRISSPSSQSAAPHERRVVGRRRRRRRAPITASAVSHTGDWHASSRRRAVARGRVKRVEAGERRPRMTGMVERVAEQVQGHHRVDPRRLDAAPRAVGLLAGDDPALGLGQRPLAAAGADGRRS